MHKLVYAFIILPSAMHKLMDAVTVIRLITMAVHKLMDTVTVITIRPVSYTHLTLPTNIAV